MTPHPLAQLLQDAAGFVLVGDSSADRFPAYSYASYTRAGVAFHCLDLGGLSESRGPESGGPVYSTVQDLPAERSDLAVIWVHPKAAAAAVEAAHEAGCRRIWFSFQTGHRDAVARAEELGLEVVEIGRCPVYFIDGGLAACVAHRALVRVSGTRRKAPQTDPEAPRRELY